MSVCVCVCEGERGFFCTPRCTAAEQYITPATWLKLPSLPFSTSSQVSKQEQKIHLKIKRVNIISYSWKEQSSHSTIKVTMAEIQIVLTQNIDVACVTLWCYTITGKRRHLWDKRATRFSIDREDLMRHLTTPQTHSLLLPAIVLWTVWHCSIWAQGGPERHFCSGSVSRFRDLFLPEQFQAASSPYVRFLIVSFPRVCV